MASKVYNLIKPLGFSRKFSGPLIVLFFLLLNTVGAQEIQSLKGLILIDFNDLPAPDVIIENRNSFAKVSSDLTGGFYIAAKAGDTLAFKGNFIEERKLIVKPSFFDLNPLIVHLNIETIRLDSIIIKPKLTGFIKEDIRTVQLSNDIEKLYANIGLDIRTRDLEPKEKQGTILPSVFGIPIPTSLDIETLAKTISGYYKKQKNLAEYEAFSKSIYTAKDYFGEAYFVKELSIPKTEIFNFLDYVHTHSDGEYVYLIQIRDFLSLDHLFRKKVNAYLLHIKNKV